MTMLDDRPAADQAAIARQSGSFAGAANASIFYQTWTPASARALVVVCHGYAEHSDRYVHVAEALSARSLAVWAIDHRGHGRSDGVRAAVDHFVHFVADLATFIDLARSQNPGLPVFLLGHSMGGLISTWYAFDNQSQLRGLILSGPAFAIADNAPRALLAVAGLISTLTPLLPVTPFDISGISRDPAVVEKVMNDPLFYRGRLRARLGHELLTAASGVLAEAPRLTLPLLIVQGDADTIANPRGAQAVFDAVGSADKTMRRFPHAYHEIFNEPEKEEALAVVGDWIEARL